jgi:hypothetical protein
MVGGNSCRINWTKFGCRPAADRVVHSQSIRPLHSPRNATNLLYQMKKRCLQMPTVKSSDIGCFRFQRQHQTKYRSLIRLASGWLLVLVCSERQVLLTSCWWLVCSERKLLLVGWWLISQTNGLRPCDSPRAPLCYHINDMLHVLGTNQLTLVYSSEFTPGSDVSLYNPSTVPSASPSKIHSYPTSQSDY